MPAIDRVPTESNASVELHSSDLDGIDQGREGRKGEDTRRVIEAHTGRAPAEIVVIPQRLAEARERRKVEYASLRTRPFAERRGLVENGPATA